MRPTITIRNVEKFYAGGESLAVRSVNLAILPGELTILMGPSGSGKTTLLSMIGGVLSPTRGEISVCGTALKSGSRPEEKDRTRAMLASAESEVARRKATHSFQVKSAEAQVEQARAQVELASAELDKTRMLAQVNGTVVRKYMYPGEVIDVLHPQPVVTLADLTQLRLAADVDESDYAQLHPGQRVTIAIESASDAKSYTGTVDTISPITGQKRFSTGEAKERQDVKIIEAIIKFDTPPPAR